MRTLFLLRSVCSLVLLLGCIALVAATPTHAAQQNFAAQEEGGDSSGFATDGPYVRRNPDGTFECKRVFVDEKGTRVVVEQLPKSKTTFELAVPEFAVPLTVTLRAPAEPEATRFPAPQRLFVLSDIEGNLPALLRLLRAGGVVDERLNWTFGKGRLVFLGDMFDRGLQVTECLWVLYELEARAKAAGGAVHFVLGNHEVMNLTGDLRYVRRKYQQNALLMLESLEELYSSTSVLGQWLRTRNVALQIGDELFVHGGVSPSVAASGATLEQLNKTLHAALAAERWTKPTDGPLALAAGSPEGLIWYRGYLKAPQIASEELDAVLKKLAVRRIVVGHTVVDDVSLVHGGRVLAVDVHHASGHSQAALRDKGGWQRVDANGARTKL